MKKNCETIRSLSEFDRRYLPSFTEGLKKESYDAIPSIHNFQNELEHKIEAILKKNLKPKN